MGKITISTTKKSNEPMRSYRNKVRTTTSWYNHIIKNRQEKDGKGRIKKDLRPLSYFIDRISKPKTQD